MLKAEIVIKSLNVLLARQEIYKMATPQGNQYYSMSESEKQFDEEYRKLIFDYLSKKIDDETFWRMRAHLFSKYNKRF